MNDMSNEGDWHKFTTLIISILLHTPIAFKNEYSLSIHLQNLSFTQLWFNMVGPGGGGGTWVLRGAHTFVIKRKK